MKKSRLLGAVCAVVFSFISMSANAALVGRDLDGNLSTAEAYYDTVLEITWLADANYAGTTMDWATANSWAAGLDPYSSGITGWRLPDTNPIDGTTANDATTSSIGTQDRGYNVSAPGTLYAGSTASEMAYLFYNTLGNLGICDPALSTTSSCSGPQAGYGLTNTGPFSNVQSSYYWSSTAYAPDATDFAWNFFFFNGFQGHLNNASTTYAWAVHSDDVGAAVVPVPAAVWLFGSGLFGLVGIARRKKAA